MTKILKCSCDHKFQDEKYGKSKRVHNACSADKNIQWRCTVCKSVKSK